MVINFRPLKSDLKPKYVEVYKPAKRRKSDYVKKESEFGFLGTQTETERFALYDGRHYGTNGHIRPC